MYIPSVNILSNQISVYIYGSCILSNFVYVYGSHSDSIF